MDEQRGESILVTGGCGYIGSHVVCKLSELGYRVVVVDDLSTGHREALLHGELLYEGDVADSALIRRIVEGHHCTAVLHFAGSILVAESVADPLRYYANNVSGFIGLLAGLHGSTVQHLILSSSAAVYGESQAATIQEDHPTVPINPYGRSKLMDEWILQDTAAASNLRFVSLRYFNVAGADHLQRIGQQGSNATHLIKMASEVAVGERAALQIYGDQYPTPDGTCLRDYIHVEDLAEAHCAALAYLRAGGDSTTLNCGYGRGFSIRDVVAAMSDTLGRPIPARVTEARPGDPAVLVADNHKILQTLAWQPKRDSLAEIIKSAVDWEAALADKRRRSSRAPEADA